MKTVIPEQLENMKSAYKTLLHQMIDSVDDEEVLLYLFTFDRLYIEDSRSEKEL